MRRAAAWAKTENDGHALERVREATGLPEGGAEVEARDRVRGFTEIGYVPKSRVIFKKNR